MATTKHQEQECQHDTAASKEKKYLLPAPETLATQDQQSGEANIDKHADDDDPPLRGNSQNGERCQQIIAYSNPAVLPSSSPDGRERNRYGKSEGKPGVKSY